MHPESLKSRILAAYVNSERPPGVDVVPVEKYCNYDNVRAEDVAHWLIEHDPKMWAGWCHKYSMRFDPERDEFIDLSEWGFALASRSRHWTDWDEYLKSGRLFTEILEAFFEPDPSSWKELTESGKKR